MSTYEADGPRPLRCLSRGLGDNGMDWMNGLDALSLWSCQFLSFPQMDATKVVGRRSVGCRTLIECKHFSGRMRVWGRDSARRWNPNEPKAAGKSTGGVQNTSAASRYRPLNPFLWINGVRRASDMSNYPHKRYRQVTMMIPGHPGLVILGSPDCSCFPAGMAPCLDGTARVHPLCRWPRDATADK